MEYLAALRREENRVRNLFLGLASGAVLLTLGFLGFQRRSSKN